MTNHVPPSDEDAVFGPPPLDVHSALDPYRGRLHRRLPELLNVEQLCRHGGDLLSSRCEALIDVDDFKLPLISLTLGKPETAKHCLLLTGKEESAGRVVDLDPHKMSAGDYVVDKKGLKRLLTVERESACGMDLSPGTGVEDIDSNRVRSAPRSLVQAWYGGNVHTQTQ